MMLADDEPCSDPAVLSSPGRSERIAISVNGLREDVPTRTSLMDLAGLMSRCEPVAVTAPGSSAGRYATAAGDPRLDLDPEAHAVAAAPVASSAGLAFRGLAIAVNDTVVPRSVWASTILAPGDHVEILSIAPGG